MCCSQHSSWIPVENEHLCHECLSERSQSAVTQCCSQYFAGALAGQHLRTSSIMEALWYMRCLPAHPRLCCSPHTSSLTADVLIYSSATGYQTFRTLQPDTGLQFLQSHGAFSGFLASCLRLNVLQFLTFKASFVDAAPPGKTFSIFIVGWILDSIPPEILIPWHHKQRVT